MVLPSDGTRRRTSGVPGDVFEVIGEMTSEEEPEPSSGVLASEESSAKVGETGLESNSSSGVEGTESASWWPDIVPCRQSERIVWCFCFVVLFYLVGGMCRQVLRVCNGVEISLALLEKRPEVAQIKLNAWLVRSRGDWAADAARRIARDQYNWVPR